MQSHIPEPPHSAGVTWKGPRPKIDPAQVPSPIAAIEADRQAWEETTYASRPGSHPPLSTSEFVAFDQGNSTPRFVRVSTWSMPYTSRLAEDCAIPLAAVVQPFADLDPREEAIPVIDFGHNGPPRCSKCRGYINPWCTWIAGGNRWKCNLCGHETPVTTEYFCNLDNNMLRLDHAQRPELMKGTVDFIVPEEYWAIHPPPRINPSYFPSEPLPTGAKKPLPMNYVFAFDVSGHAIESGFLKFACNALRTILYGGTSLDGNQLDPCFPPASQIAILTFDYSIHFYDLNSDTTPMFVVGDLEEVFVPMRHGLFVDPIARRPTIEALLNALPERFTEFPLIDSSLGSALQGILASLAGRGGHAIIFQASLPTSGPGALHGQPPEGDLFDTDKEKILHKPRDKLWLDLGEELAEEGIGVSMFLAPQKYMDIGSVGAISSLTGGELFYHPRFDAARDAVSLESQLQRLMRRYQGYNCTMRIRCSNGLRVNKHLGNFLQSSPTDLEFGILDADKAIVVELEHSGSLNPRSYAFIQCATLYTTIWGERRVRLINLALQIVELAGNVFRYADLDTTLCFFAREAASNMKNQKLSSIKEELSEKCTALLLGYRQKCAAATVSSQLVIPEAFRAFPAFLLALFKSKSLKGRQISSDVRNYDAHRIMSMSPKDLIHRLYPRLLALHDLDDDIALPQTVEAQDGTRYQSLTMPSLMRNSYFYMEAHGMYLIDDDEWMILWIGSSVSPQLLQDLFGTDDFMSLNYRTYHLPVLETRLSRQVHNIISNRANIRGRKPKMLIARQNMDAAELEFADFLVEDTNNATMSYPDYLSHLHIQISAILRNGGDIVTPATLRSPW